MESFSTNPQSAFGALFQGDSDTALFLLPLAKPQAPQWLRHDECCFDECPVLPNGNQILRQDESSDPLPQQPADWPLPQSRSAGLRPNPKSDPRVGGNRIFPLPVWVNSAALEVPPPATALLDKRPPTSAFQKTLSFSNPPTTSLTQAGSHGIYDLTLNVLPTFPARRRAIGGMHRDTHTSSAWLCQE